MEEAREKFRDFWSPPLDELIQSWLRMETLQTLHRTRSTHGLMRIFEDKYSALIRNKGRFLFPRRHAAWLGTEPSLRN